MSALHGPKRYKGNGGHWLVAAWHWPSSYTWRWLVAWSPLRMLAPRIGHFVPGNGHGMLRVVLPLWLGALEIKWQPNAWMGL